MGQVDANAVYGVVRRLIESCQSGRRRFEAIASEIDDTLLRAEMMQYAIQNQKFADELSECIKTGEARSSEAFTSGSESATWTVGKAVDMRDRLKVIEQSKAIEMDVLKAYASVDPSSLPSAIATIIRMQEMAAQRVFDRLRFLREQSDQAKMQ